MGELYQSGAKGTEKTEFDKNDLVSDDTPYSYQRSKEHPSMPISPFSKELVSKAGLVQEVIDQAVEKWPESLHWLAAMIIAGRYEENGQQVKDDLKIAGFKNKIEGIGKKLKMKGQNLFEAGLIKITTEDGETTSDKVRYPVYYIDYDLYDPAIALYANQKLATVLGTDYHLQYQLFIRKSNDIDTSLVDPYDVGYTVSDSEQEKNCLQTDLTILTKDLDPKLALEIIIDHWSTLTTSHFDDARSVVEPGAINRIRAKLANPQFDLIHRIEGDSEYFRLTDHVELVYLPMVCQEGRVLEYALTYRVIDDILGEEGSFAQLEKKQKQDFKVFQQMQGITG